MRKQIKQKLNNNSGMSILYALLMFLMAVLVCTVIIAASLTSAKAVHNDFAEEQAYLTSESAAKLMQNNIEAVTVSEVETTVYAEDGGSSTSKEYKSESSSPSKTLCLAVLKKAVQYIDDNPGSTFSLSAQGSSDLTITTDEMEPVQYEFNMDENYNIRMSFTMEQSQIRTVPYLVLKMNAQTSESQDTGQTETGEYLEVNSRQISWSYDSLINMSNKEDEK